jgi:hypothetical protein
MRPHEAKGPLYTPRIFNALSRQRFIADRTTKLIKHLGRDPSFPERLILGRIVMLEWELRRQDAKLEAGEELSGHALRARLAAENRLRLDLKAIGMAPASAKPLSPREYLAAKHGTAA